MESRIDNELSALKDEFKRLRRANRSLWLALLVCAITIFSVAVLLIRRPIAVQASTTDPEGILHVRGLIVEDQQGRERLRLGAPLPDPMIHGVRHKRQGAISGLLISDANGNERGGLVTSDQFGEAFLGLDSEDAQQVLFLVNPKGGTHLDLFDQHGNEADLGVFPKGPHFVLKREHALVTELPQSVK